MIWEGTAHMQEKNKNNKYTLFNVLKPPQAPSVI